jgi:branched-subunit amino acid aminotransferase/4-amino-4-deoxychorismate lyase
MEGIGVRLHDIPDEMTMWAIPFGRYIQQEEGAHVCFSSWQRVDDNAIPARGKVSGSYANSALIKSDAMLSGYDEALVLNQNGHVSEASASNVFIVRKGVAITKVEHRQVGNGAMGDITTSLRDLYMNVVYGRVAKYREWLSPVYVNAPVR